DGQGPVEPGQGLIQPAQLQKDGRAIAERLDEVGLEGQGAVETVNRLLVSPQPHQGYAAHANAVEKKRIQAHHLAENALCLFELSGLKASHSDRVFSDARELFVKYRGQRRWRCLRSMLPVVHANDHLEAIIIYLAETDVVSAPNTQLRGCV